MCKNKYINQLENRKKVTKGTHSDFGDRLYILIKYMMQVQDTYYGQPVSKYLTFGLCF